MSEIAVIAVTAIVVVATTFLTLAVVGLIRIPNTYVKVHAMSKAVAVGPLLVLVATLPLWDLGLIVRAILVGAFTLVSAAVSGHAIIRLEKQRSEEV